MHEIEKLTNRKSARVGLRDFKYTDKSIYLNVNRKPITSYVLMHPLPTNIHLFNLCIPNGFQCIA